MSSSRITAIFALCLFGAVAVFAFWLVLWNPYPTDAETERHFRDNRGDFELLAKMLTEDKELNWVTDKRDFWSEFEKPFPLSDIRKREYIGLIDKLGILRIDCYDRPGVKQMDLTVWTTPNMVIGAKTKLIIYNLRHPKKDVDSLDKLYRGGDDVAAWKRIDDHWSMMLDVW